ncbi:hypothetical protein ACFLYY_00490 [Patescibacteria group bacterium]
MVEKPERHIESESQKTNTPEIETKKAAPISGTAVSSKQGPIKVKGKKGGGKIKKIPTNVLLSPGGVVLIFSALIIEVIDWIPILGVDALTWELILEIGFMVELAIIAKMPLSSMIIPLIVERIPVVSDIVPSFLIRLFV